MATIVAAAGGGNWQTNGTWVGGVKPTAADDAQLNATSGNVTIDSGAVCRSLDCTGYTGTLTHNSAATLTIGTSTPGTGNKALTFVSGMTYTKNDPATSALSFVSTSTTQQTITWASKSPGNLTFNGAGGSWLFGDNTGSSGTGALTLTAGTLNINSKITFFNSCNLSGSTTRAFTMGSGFLTLTGSGASVFNAATTTGFTFLATGGTIQFFSGATDAEFIGSSSAGFNWANVGLIFGGTGNMRMTLAAANTVGNLTISANTSKTSTFTIGSSNLTVTGTFSCMGNTATTRQFVKSSVLGTATTITAATVSVTNTDFMDITGAGAGSWNLSAVAGGSGDCGGNTGITFTTAAAQTHTTSAGGNWSDITKWTSRVPLPQDDVVVDANTTGTLTADMPRLGKTLNFTGFAGTLDVGSAGTLGASIHGGLTFASGMTISNTNVDLTFRGRSSFNLNFAGLTYPSGGFAVSAPSGTYTAVSTLACDGTLSVNAGTFNGNSRIISCGALDSSTSLTRTLTLDSCNVSLTGTGSITPTIVNINSSVSLSAFMSVMTITAASSITRTFAGGGKAYSNLIYTVAGSTGGLIITGANSFYTLSIGDNRTLTLPSSTTTTTREFILNGSAGALATLNSSTPGTAATLTSIQPVYCTYASIKDSTVTSTLGSFCAPLVSSVNVSGNTGWSFIPIDTDNLLVPGGDRLDGTWKDQAAGTNLSAAIDETVVSDADYMQSGVGPFQDIAEVFLETANDPLSSSGHIVRYRYQKNVSAGAVDLNVDLCQGNVAVQYDGGSASITVGYDTGHFKIAQYLIVPSNQPINYIQLRAQTASGSPTDIWNVEIQTDSAGSPSGTVVSSGTFDSTVLVSPFQMVNIPLNTTISTPGTYWIVVYRTGAAGNPTINFGCDGVLYNNTWCKVGTSSNVWTTQTFNTLIFSASYVIASWTHTNISNAWTTVNQTLSSGQADSITNYADLSLRFRANMTATDVPPTKVADRASVNNNTGSTTADYVLTGMTVGNFLIIRTAADNSGTSGAARTVTLSNFSGTPINVATSQKFQQNNAPGSTASGGTTINVCVCPITATSGTVRITYSGSVVQAGVAEEWSGIDSTFPVQGGSSGATATASTNLANLTFSVATPGYLAYAAMAVEGPSSDTYTQDTDTTAGSWVGLTKLGTSNATADTNQTIYGAYKLPTVASSQSYDATVNNARDSAGFWLVLTRQTPNIRAQVSWAQLEIPAGGGGGAVIMRIVGKWSGPQG